MISLVEVTSKKSSSFPRGPRVQIMLAAFPLWTVIDISWIIDQLQAIKMPLVIRTAPIHCTIVLTSAIVKAIDGSSTMALLPPRIQVNIYVNGPNFESTF